MMFILRSVDTTAHRHLLAQFDLITREEARRRNIKVVDAKWLDTNKGDADNPNLRSRCVGREFNTGKMEGLFAGTPPLEAVRFLIHEAATVRAKDDQQEKVIMINGVARAFFEAPAVRQVCVELPDEDLSSSDRSLDKVGHLAMSFMEPETPP